jgi:WD40 repeat protein
LAPGQNYEKSVPPLLLDKLIIDANQLKLEEVAARVVASATKIPVEEALYEVRSRALRRKRLLTVIFIALAGLTLLSASLALYAGKQRAEAEARRAKLEQLRSQSGALAISPDGTTFATSTPTDEVVIWDVKSGRLLLTLKEQQGSALAFSPDGGKLAAASWDGALTVWDISTGAVLHRFEGEKPIMGLQFSPNGQELYSRAVDGTIQEWSVLGGKLLRMLKPPQSTP